MRIRDSLSEQRSFHLFFIVALVFSAVMYYFQPVIALIQAVFCIVIYFVLQSVFRKKNEEVLAYVKSRDKKIEMATKGMVQNAPLPMVIFQPETDQIIWSNPRFLNMTGDDEHLFDMELSKVLPDFQWRWITDGKTEAPNLFHVKDKQYEVFGNLIDGDLAIAYWVDVTEYAALQTEFENTRPMAAIVLIDNYEELMRNIEESERSSLMSELNEQIKEFAEQMNGMICKYERDHFLIISEELNDEQLEKKALEILDKVRLVRNSNEIIATISIGLSKRETSIRELYKQAAASVEMALARGGDQIVIKEEGEYQFLGGKSKEVERRTKIKTRVTANAFTQLLDGITQVIIMGHQNPDLDVFGAAAGLCAIVRKQKCPVYIVHEKDQLTSNQMIEELASLTEYESVFIDEDEAFERMSVSTMLIVVDTNRPEQTQVPSLLNKAGRLVLIDHHRRASSYIENSSLAFEDPYASSASELVVELMQHLLEPGDLLQKEAEACLAGIMLDTKKFTMRTGGATFDAASYLRRWGADTAKVSTLFQSSLDETVLRYEIIQNTHIFREEIAIAVSNVPVNRIIVAQVADELNNIAHINASFVLAPDGESGIMLSARSIGEINVQLIVEELGGGGNTVSAGAKMDETSLEEAEMKLKQAIHSYFDD